MQRRNDAALVLLLVLAVALSFAVQRHSYRLSVQAAYGTAVEDAVRKLRVERDELRGQQAALQKQLDEETEGKGVGLLVVTELAPALYEEAYPILQKQGICGLLAVSSGQFPGQRGCITAAQAEEMLADGWQLCLLWDAWTPLEEELAALAPLLEAQGWQLPQTVYFAPGRYAAEYDPALEQAGFTILICHGEEGTDALNRSDETALWHLTSLSWNRSGIKAFLNRAAKYGGAFAMNLDFGTRRSGFQPLLLAGMCDYIVRQQNLVLMLPQPAREYRDSVRINEALQAEIDWYQSEIDEITREIDAIYRDN